MANGFNATERPTLRFGEDGHFSVMQISDVQDTGGLHPRSVELLTAALDREKPDFVILTGDQIKGYGMELKFASPAKRIEIIRQTLDELLELFDERNIPFSFVFGNHDHDAPMAPQEQVEYYQRDPLCLAQDSPEGVPGYANHVIPVMDAKGEKAELLFYLLDSHGPKGLGYSPLEAGQVDWYRQQRDEWAEKSGGPVPSMLYMHVPVEEIIELYRAVPKMPGALEGFGSHSGQFYILDKSKVAPGSYMGELPSSPDENAGLFDAALERGEMLGMFFGHDHKNGFHGDVRGITLGYAPGAGYSTYGPGRKRGVRMFRFDEKDLHNAQTYVVTDEQILGEENDLDWKVKVLMDMQPSSFGGLKPMFRKMSIVGSLAAVSTAALVVSSKIKPKKK